MPYQPHLKISYIGERRAGSTSPAVETWTFATRWAPVSGVAFPTNGSTEDMDALAAAGATNAGAFFNQQWFEDSVYLTETRAYMIGADGKAVGNIGYNVLATPFKGAATHKYPFQVAHSVSLVAEGRGKGKYGRVYLPGSGTQVNSDGLLPVPACTTLATNFAQYMGLVDTALAARLGQDVELVVAGTTGAGTLRPVREIWVGRVLDTQRRRRRSLTEVHQKQTYPFS